MKRLVAATLVVLAVAASCGGDDSGDIDAFCALVRQGVGDLSGGPAEAAALDGLLGVSPEAIRPAVEQMRNLAREFTEIDPTALDQLFAAAFDSQAQSARQEFDVFVAEACNVDNATSGGAQLLDTSELASELAAFVSDRFGDDSWTDKVRYEVAIGDDQPWAVRVVFDDASEGDEAMTACGRVSVWLYDVKQQDGSVEVVDDEPVAARGGPQGSCAERSVDQVD